MATLTPLRPTPDHPGAGPTGLHRVAFVPGLTTAGELAEALAGVPDTAVFMGGGAGLDSAELEFAEFGSDFDDEPRAVSP